MNRFLFALVACLCFVPIGFQPAIAQEPFKPQPDTPAVVSDAAMASFYADPGQAKLSAFRKTLLDTADKACKSGEISRAEVFKLRIATLNQKVLKQMHQAVAEHAVAEGVAASPTAIDWSKVAEIIKQLLPVILELISLFK